MRMIFDKERVNVVKVCQVWGKVVQKTAKLLYNYLVNIVHLIYKNCRKIATLIFLKGNAEKHYKYTIIKNTFKNGYKISNYKTIK